MPTVQAPPEPPEPISRGEETRFPKRRISALWARRGDTDHDFMVMLSTAWNRFVGDVLANILLYLGVLLATASIFAFFALGHFGEVVTNADLRPIVFVAVPLLFGGMARLLRSRVSVAYSADAIGVIGALTLPIMMSGLFRDGSDVPIPDVGGSGRWVLYALVAVICGAVYFLLSRGRAVYAYLVAPIIWMGVGSLGLFITFGTSSYQLYAVLLAMSITVWIAARFTTNRVALAAVRIAPIAFPGVLLTAIVFGVRNGDDPLGPSPAIAAMVTGLVLMSLSTVRNAWEPVERRSRIDLRAGLRAAGHASLALALILGVSALSQPTWLGPALLGYAVLVSSIERRYGASERWILLGTRITAAIGVAASLPFLHPSIVTLSFLAAVAGVWLAGGRLAGVVRDFIGPQPDDAALTDLAPWIPLALVAGGLIRLAEPWGQLSIAGLALVMALTRFVSAGSIKSFAAWPVLGVGYIAVVHSVMSVALPGLGSGHALAFGLLAAAGALCTVTWAVRGWLALPAAVAAATILAPAGQELTVLSAGSAAIAVVALVAAQIPVLRSHALANAMFGHVFGLFGYVISFVVADDRAALAYGTLLAAALVVEAVLARHGRLAWLVDLTAHDAVSPAWASAPLAAAAVVAAAVVADVWFVVGDRSIVSAAAAGFGAVIAVLSTTGNLRSRDARPIVYSFATVGVVTAFGTVWGPIATAVAVASIGVLFHDGRRRADAYACLAGGAVVVVQAADAVSTPRLAAMSLVGYGVALTCVASLRSIVRHERTLEESTVPVLVVGIAGMLLGVVSLTGSTMGLEMLGHTEMALLASASAAATMAFALAGWAHRWLWSGTVVVIAGSLSWAFAVFAVTLVPIRAMDLWPAVGALALAGFLLPERDVLDPLRSPGAASLLGAAVLSVLSVTLAADADATGYSLVVVAGVMAVMRVRWSLKPLRYAAVAAALIGAALVSPEAALVAVTGSMALTVAWERTADGPEGVALRWVAAILMLWDVGIAMTVFAIPVEPSAMVFHVIGLALVVSGLFLGTVVPSRAMARWWPQAAVVGRCGVIVGLLIMSQHNPRGAAFMLSAWLFIEAGVLARYASLRMSVVLAWMAMSTAVASGIVFTAATGAPVDVSAVAWWFFGTAALAGWVSVVRWERRSLWVQPLGAYAHLAIVGATLVGAGSFPSIDGGRYAASATLLVFGAAWLVVARTLDKPALAAGSGIAIALGYCAATFARDAASTSYWLWLVGLAIGAVLVQWSSRRGSTSTPVAAAGAFAVTMLLCTLEASLSSDGRSMWLHLAVVLLVAGLGVMDLPHLRHIRPTGSEVGRGLVVLAAAALGPWYRPDDAASVALLVAVTAAGALAAVASATRDERWHPDAVMWIGLQAAALLSALVVYGWPEPVTLVVAVACAGSIIAHGVLGGSQRTVMIGAELMVVIGAALWLTGRDSSLLIAATVAAIAILIATESERIIAAAEGGSTANWVKRVEWVTLLGYASILTYLAVGEVGHVGPLAIFGGVALVIGILTQVRRRVFVGVASIGIATVVALVAPFAQAADVGFGTSIGVLSAFAAAVVIIVVAILIERYGRTVGAGLSKVSDLMSTWD